MSGLRSFQTDNLSVRTTGQRIVMQDNITGSTIILEGEDLTLLFQMLQWLVLHASEYTPISAPHDKAEDRIRRRVVERITRAGLAGISRHDLAEGLRVAAPKTQRILDVLAAQQIIDSFTKRTTNGKTVTYWRLVPVVVNDTAQG